MGAWLDATFDRAKEYAYYAGLALGAARGGDDVWALALGAMVLMTCRHVVDFSFNEANHDATANTSPTAALSGKLDSVGWTVWVRRMIVLPIGERWFMIAVLTALTTPRIVFYALLIGCALAACYTTAGRVLRSLTRRARRTDRAAQALADLADSGPLAELIARGARGRGRTGSFLAPVMAFLSAAVLLVWVLFEDDPTSWLTVGVAVCSALLVARPCPARSRAPWTGSFRPSSGPVNTSPSWCWPPARTSPERCPRRSGWSRRSPTITTTRSTASAVAPGPRLGGWSGRPADTRDGSL